MDKVWEFEDVLDAFRNWTKSLGDFVEGSEAQKENIAFWLPRFDYAFKNYPNAPIVSLMRAYGNE